MSVTPTVSVIIPTYNRATYIGRAVDSVIAQTYVKLEILVIDDASTDGTGDIVRSYQDSRLTYIRHDQNRGGSASRNTGISRATGEFVAFLDSDDEWVPEKVARHLEVFRANPECAVVYSAVQETYSDGSIRVTGANGPQGDVFSDLIQRNVVGPTSAFVVRRECFETVGGFDETLPSAQDYDMWLRLARRFLFAHIPEPLVVYHWHGDQISTNLDAKLRGRLAILQKYLPEIRMAGSCTEASHHSDLGRQLCEHGDFRVGRKHLRTAAVLCPANLSFVLTYILSLFGRGVYSVAVRLLRFLRSLDASGAQELRAGAKE